MQCQKCHKEFSRQERIASMSGSVMGDECTDVYFFCSDCEVYSVESWHDNFTGTESSIARGLLPKAEGDAIVENVQKCPEPWDKKCRCDAHRRHFNDTLD